MGDHLCHNPLIEYYAILLYKRSPGLLHAVAGVESYL